MWRRILKKIVVSLAVLLCLPAVLSAQEIVLSQDFDSGSLDVAASNVNGSSIELVARQSWTGVNGYRWVYFSADNVKGLAPRFSISESGFLGSYEDHRYVYSYDQQNWEFFDNASTSGGNYEFTNNTAFAQDKVFVAYSLPYPVGRIEAMVQLLQANPYVTNTKSGDAGFVIGQSAAAVDDTGRTIPVQDLYGFKITDPKSTGYKQQVLLAAGSHSCETGGNFALEGLLDFLLSDDPRAHYLREVMEFYIYPLTNPGGRFGGYYRSTPENPDKDYNRYFDDPVGFTDLAALTASMQIDTGGDVDILMDFHSWFGSWTAENFIFAVPSLVDDPFFTYLETLEPGLLPVASNGVPGMLRIWGSSPDGLNAEFAITPEIGFHPFRYETDLKSIGTSFGIALYDRSVSAFVAVDAVSITRGILINGGVKELAQSDNIDVVAIRSSADVQSRVFFEFSGISPLENPASFEFSIESAVFARSQVDQSIDLFNFDSNSWEEVYVGIASPFVDDELLAEAGGDLSRFVQSGTRTIEARCRYQSVNPRQQFSANVDRALWVIR